LAQAKARAAAGTETVVSFASGAVASDQGAAVVVLHARIDETPDPETGAPRLRVIIPGKKAPEIHNLSRLLVQPEIARFLAEGFRQWATSAVGGRTRRHYCQMLNFQFGAFLRTVRGKVSPAEIDEAFWTSLIAWLNGPRRKNGQPWAQGTRAVVLKAVTNCIDGLLDDPDLGEVVTHLKDRSGFPYNPWPGKATKYVPTAVLSRSERRALILACLGEIAAVRDHLEEREAILEAGRAMLEEARAEGRKPPYRDYQEFRARLGHSDAKGASRWHDARNQLSPTRFWTSCWPAATRRRHLTRTACLTS
jgi:hypothetical protein